MSKINTQGSDNDKDCPVYNGTPMELKKELDEIRDSLKQKQDRIKPIVWVPLGIWMLTQSIAGTWWAATLTEKLDNLQQTVESGATSKFTTNDAEAAFELRDQRDDFLQDQIDALRESLKASENR